VNGTMSQVDAHKLYQALQVPKRIAWRIAKHGISPEQTMSMPDEELLALQYVGPVSVRELRELVSRISLPTPIKAVQTEKLPRWMNRCRGITGATLKDSRSELVALGCEVISDPISSGRTEIYEVILPEGMVLCKDFESDTNFWWSLFDHFGRKHAEVYFDITPDSPRYFLNILDVSSISAAA
jgi:hypothetical protein